MVHADDDADDDDSVGASGKSSSYGSSIGIVRWSVPTSSPRHADDSASCSLITSASSSNRERWLSSCDCACSCEKEEGKSKME